MKARRFPHTRAHGILWPVRRYPHFTEGHTEVREGSSVCSSFGEGNCWRDVAFSHPCPGAARPPRPHGDCSGFRGTSRGDTAMQGADRKGVLADPGPQRERGRRKKDWTGEDQQGGDAAPSRGAQVCRSGPLGVGGDPFASPAPSRRPQPRGATRTAGLAVCPALTAGTGSAQTASLAPPQARAHGRGGARGAPGGRGAACPEPGFGKSSRRFLARVAAGACLPGCSHPQAPPRRSASLAP